MSVHHEFPMYSGCGNTFFIFPLPNEEAFLLFKKNEVALQELAELGKTYHVDSVMVVVGDPAYVAQQGYHVSMYVFEPHAYHPDHSHSAWSTMCGNGIRAVAEYLVDRGVRSETMHINTLGGVHHVVAVRDLWRVDMGMFTRNREDLSYYVRPSGVLTTNTFHIASKKIEPTVHVGFHFHNTEKKDGEPHAVLFTHKKMNRFFLQRYTKQYGKLITHNQEVFPHEINTSVASIDDIQTDAKKIIVSAATYERNIYYITKACGTASTVIGALLFERFSLSSDWKIEVHVPGGVLLIEKDDQENYYLTGDVQACGVIPTPIDNNSKLT